ncbi:hypothetical protein [Glycomyces arizonensis]|uniref:hypothetical protein n=1 Tax=Glycomyces arizonensis TaxID=256035 RepID=UPI00041C4274|nr:hypothetical protein [Glycomyces arizonensis]
MSGSWPEARVDDLTRFRVLASGVSGARVVERRINAPFEQVWALVSDIEGSFGDIEPDMRGVTVVRREGDRVEAIARSRFGMRARLRGTVRPGWCWLQSRFLIIGIAAVPDGKGGTVVAMTGGVRVPGRAALVPIGVERAARRSLARLAAACG